MTRTEHIWRWIIGAAVVGGVASVLVAALVWLLLTRPVAVAVFVDRAF